MNPGKKTEVAGANRTGHARMDPDAEVRIVPDMIHEHPPIYVAWHQVFGKGRYDPRNLPSRVLERFFTVATCVVCDRVFAFKNGHSRHVYVTCGPDCAQKWMRTGSKTRKKIVNKRGRM